MVGVVETCYFAENLCISTCQKDRWVFLTILLSPVIVLALSLGLFLEILQFN